MHIGHAVAEDEIISQCKKGSLKHQEMMYKVFYTYAMGISLRYSVNREDAVEVVNDAFIKVFKSINSYTDDKPFKPWLRRVLVNTAIDRRRKELRQQLNTGIENASNVYTCNTVIKNSVVWYELPMGKTNRFIVEPFIKYPIDGLGEQQIRFGAGGINLKFNFKP